MAEWSSNDEMINPFNDFSLISNFTVQDIFCTRVCFLALNKEYRNNYCCPRIVLIGEIIIRFHLLSGI